MKRILDSKIVLAMVVVVMVAFLPMNVRAAGPTYTAAYGTPTIDGVVNSSEYGPAVPFNSSNLSLFYYNLADQDPTTANANFPDLTYSFAWDEGHLYVGITARNVDITDARFQIDLSPNKKIKDNKPGIFYTFKCIVVGEDGLMGISRDNFQGGSIAKNCKSASREVAGGVYNLEIAIPLSELQVTAKENEKGKGNFTALELKSGEWGIGCYMVGNDGGYTNTLGAGCNEEVGYDKTTGGGLIEYYNTLTLAAKPSSNPSGGNTNTGGGQNNNNPSTPGSDTTHGGNTTGDKNTNTPGSEADQPGNTDTDNPAGTTDGTVMGGDKTTTPADDDKKDPDKDTQKDEDKTDKDKTETKKNDKNKTFFIICAVIAGVMVVGALVAAFFITRKKPTTTTNKNDAGRDSDENK